MESQEINLKKIETLFANGNVRDAERIFLSLIEDLKPNNYCINLNSNFKGGTNSGGRSIMLIYLRINAIVLD